MSSDRDPPARLEECSDLPLVRRAIGAARAELPAQERIGLLETALAAKLAALGGLGGGFDGGGGHGTGGGLGDGGAGAGGGLGHGAAGTAGAAGVGAAGAGGGIAVSTTGGTGAAVSGAALGGAGKTVAASFAAKAIGTVVLATSVASGGWYATHQTETPRAPASVVTAAPSAPPPPAAPVESFKGIAIAPKPPEKAAPSAKVAPRGTDAPLESEMDLLRRAQDTLSTNPKRALSMCDQHKEHFANGDFAQEREVIAIDALLRLGRRREAEARAERFDKAYPTSAHRRRIDSLLTQ